MTFFRHVTFDLDDTLLDTSGSLIPAAARRAIEAMSKALRTPDNVQILLAKRIEILRADPRADVWLRLAQGDEEVADIGRRAFFTHPIETLPDEALRPTAGAFEILTWAREHATLHLVTSGDAMTQQKKIDRLGVAKYFDSIQFVEARHGNATGETHGDPTRAKYGAFRKIQTRFPEEKPTSFLSIGNRVDTDLGEAKLLGWKTAWIRYGEHASLTPQSPIEIPDFETATLEDLLSIWRQQYDLHDPKESIWKS